MDEKSNRPNYLLRPGLRRHTVRQFNTTAQRKALALPSSLTPAVPGVSPAERVKSSTASAWAVLIIVITSAVWGAGIFIGFQSALAIQVVLGLIFAILGIASPVIGLLGMGMLAALDSQASEYLLTGGLLRFNTVNYWLLIVMLLYLPFLIRLKDLNSRALQVFIALIALQLIFSQNLSAGIQDVLNISTTFGMVIYFARSLMKEEALYWLGVVNGILAGLGGLLFLLQISSLPYSNPNNWSYFQLTALLSICISLPYAHKLNKSRLILLLLAVVNIGWIFLSGSRGSLLIALICVVYLFLSTRSITWSSVMVAFAIVLGLWISTQFAEQQLVAISRIQLLFDPTRTEVERTSKRSALMEAGWKIFQENPLGIGTGSFREESAQTNLVANERPAHSAWVKTLAENGILGAVFLTIYVSSYALVGIQKHRQEQILLGLFITAALAAAFFVKEFRGKSLWFLAAAGIVLLHPEQMLEYIKLGFKTNKAMNVYSRLRKVRFGQGK